MAKLVNAQTGAIEDVPDDVAQQSLMSGGHQIPTGQQSVVVGEDGQRWEVDPAGAYEAMSQGLRLESDAERHTRTTEAQYGGAAGTVAAGLTGFARGGTLGLSDLLLTQTGMASPEMLSGLREANPVVSTGAEIGAAVAPLLLSGGASAGVTAGKGLLQTVGKQALTGAIEGAAYGAGNEISEASLGDTELTAERLLAGAGMGALLGGASAGALGLAGAGLSAAKRAAATPLAKLADSTPGTAIKSWLEDFAQSERFRAAFGVNKKAFKQLDRKGLMDKADDVLKDIVQSGDDIESIYTKTAAKLDDVSQQHKAVVELVDEATAKTPLKRLSPKEVGTRVKKEILSKIHKAENKSAHDFVEGYVEELLGGELGGVSFAEAESRRRAMQKGANYNVDGAPLAEAKKQIAGIWNDLIDEKVEPVLTALKYPDAKGAYRTLRQREGLLIEMTGHMNDRIQGNQAVRMISPSDYGMGSLGAISGLLTGGSSAAAMATGAVGAAANKFARGYGPAILADMASRAAKLSILSKQTAKNALTTNGAVIKFLDSARKTGAKVEAATPVATVKVLEGMSFLPEAIERKLVAEEDRTKTAKTETEIFKKRAREIAHLATNPDLISELVGDAMAELQQAAPGTAAHLTAKIHKAVTFLDGKLPRDPAPQNPLMKREWDPPKSAVAKFARYARAVNDPGSVAEDLRARRLTGEGVEVLQELYHKVYESLVSDVISNLSEKPAQFSYQDRVQLSLFLNKPLDPTLEPAFISAMQQRWAESPQPQQGQGGGGMRVTGIGNIQAGQATATRSQRLAGGQ